MCRRFIFRQVHWSDLSTFLADGEIRAKSHANPQLCHQTSYPEIVDRRGTHQFPMPNGRVVNDFVPFYFSPITSFTYTIFKGNVSLRSPAGDCLRMACEDDRIFLVSSPQNFYGTNLSTCFSDYALNSMAPLPTVETDPNMLASHIHWHVFDDFPKVAMISEIGYEGVCKYFHDRESPAHLMTRKAKRMAEFLVLNAVPLDKVICVIAKTDMMKAKLEVMMNASGRSIPIYTNRGCFYG